MTTIETKVDITSQQIADLMVTAVEGGINYWADGFYLESPGDVAPDDEFNGEIWYANPHRYEDPDLRIKVVESGDGDGSTDHFFGQKEIADGLRKMAEKSPSHFADIVNDNQDAITADVFLQYVVFGEIVYG